MALADLIPQQQDPNPLIAAMKANQGMQPPAPANPEMPHESPMQLGTAMGGGGGLKPLVRSPRMVQEDQLQDAISKYETPSNPTGFWGKLGHVLSQTGAWQNSGTMVARREQEDSRVKELAGLQGEDRADETQTRDNNTAASEGELRTQQTRKASDEANALENPKPDEPSLAQAYSHAVQDAMKNGRDPSTDPIVQHISDAITSLQPGQNKPTEAPKTISSVRPGDSKPHEWGWNPKTNAYDIDEGQHYERPMNINVGTREDRAMKGEVIKAYQPTLDSAERLNVMTESYEKAVKDHDQQAMLNLLANHLGMTMGLQKGARLTKDIINEAKESTPWLQGMEAKFDGDGYLSGVTLTPNQMRQMVSLGQSRYAEDTKKSRSTAQYLGAKDDGPERVPSAATIRLYTAQANGDPEKAKKLAAADGWSVK